MSKFLSKAEILAAQDIEFEEVAVPEWGGVVLVRGLTGQERDSYEASVMVRKGKSYQANLVDARAKLVARSIVDEKGELLFTAADVKQLTKKSAGALSRVYNVAARLSGVTESDLEELSKNSDSDQSDDSGSD